MLALVLPERLHLLVEFQGDIHVMIRRSDAERTDRLEIKYGRDMIDGGKFTFGDIGHAGPDRSPVHQFTDVGMIVDVIVAVVGEDHIRVGTSDEVHILDPVRMVQPDIRIFISHHDQLGTDHISAFLCLHCADGLDLRAGVIFRAHVAGTGDRHVDFVAFLDVADERTRTLQLNIIRMRRGT